MNAAEYLKLPYERVLIPNHESGTFTALIREFPGCIAEGDEPAALRGPDGGALVVADQLVVADDAVVAVELAAVVDQFEVEPLPTRSPMWDHPKIYVTPHNAAQSDPHALTKYVIAQIERDERGLPLENVVDRRLGY